MAETPDTKAAPENGDARSPGNGKPGDEVAALQARLQAAEQTRDQYLKMASQSQADFENYQKRAARDRAEERRYASFSFASDLLPALDNLDRAIAAAHQAGDKGPLTQGVVLVQKQLLDALGRHGVKRVDAQGHPFDANLHEAVMQQPTAEHPPMTILQVLEQGYQLHDRVLRPARVIVATAPA